MTPAVGGIDASADGGLRSLRSRNFVERIAAVDARTAATVGAALSLAIGVFFAFALNIWVDEAFTLHSTGAGVGTAWQQAITFEAQPPFYFAVVGAWRILDEGSIAFARLPSVAFAAAAVAVIVFATKRIAPRVPPLVAAFVALVNPVVIWAAAEMRVYPLVLLVGAVLTWTFFDGFLARVPSRRAQIAYTVFAILGLYTQYYVGFVLLANGLTLLAVRRGMLRPFIIGSAATAVAFAPFLPVVKLHSGVGGTFLSQVSFPHAVHSILGAVFVYILPHDLNWTGAAKLAPVLVAAALGVVFLALGRPTLPAEPTRCVVVEWVITIVIFAVVFARTGAPDAIVSHAIVLAPLSLIVAMVFVSSLTRLGVAAAAASVAAYAVFAGATLWSSYHPPLAKQGDWRRVAAAVTAGDRTIPIAVVPADQALPLDWYVPAGTTVVPLPRPMPFIFDYVRATAFTGESDAARALDPISARSRYVWLVTHIDCARPSASFDFHCDDLEAYVRRRYEVVKRIEFAGTTARLLESTTVRADAAARNAR